MNAFWSLLAIFALVLLAGFLLMSLRRSTHARHRPGVDASHDGAVAGSAAGISAQHRRTIDDTGSDGGDGGGD